MECLSVSFKADWVTYTAVIYLWIKSISEDKLVRKEIHRQNLFNVQALSPVMAMCKAQDRRESLWPLSTLLSRGRLPRLAHSHLQPTFFLNPVSGKHSEKKIRVP